MQLNGGGGGGGVGGGEKTGLCIAMWSQSYFSNAVIKESQAGVFVANKSTFLNEADEDLSLGELRVELLMRTISTL